jgi:predicted secreted Zn-dependent protease
MRAEGLRDRAGEAGFAITTWDVAWMYRYDEGPGTCSIDDLALRVEITVLMPAWDPPPGTDAGLMARWTRYIDSLRRHERGHELNGLETAKEVRDDLLELGSRTSCASLERAADAVGERAIRAGNERDRDYDDRTDHGATEGAVLR